MKEKKTKKRVHFKEQVEKNIIPNTPYTSWYTRNDRKQFIERDEGLKQLITQGYSQRVIESIYGESTKGVEGFKQNAFTDIKRRWDMTCPSFWDLNDQNFI